MIQASDEDILLDWDITKANIFLEEVKKQLYKVSSLPKSALVIPGPSDLYYRPEDNIYDTEL